MQKSPEAYRTISEVSKELGIPSHVLRFWETKFTHLKPMKRSGNRRYYRPQDILLLRCIRKYLYDDGYTIKGLQKLFREQGCNPKQQRINESKLSSMNSNKVVLHKSIENLIRLSNYIESIKFQNN